MTQRITATRARKGHAATIDTPERARRQVARETEERRRDANLRRAEERRRRYRGRYYRRHRELPTVGESWEDAAGTLHQEQGVPVRALTTRYGFGLWRRRPHGVYYASGTWWRIENVPGTISADGTREGHYHAYVPIADEWLTDLHQQQTVEQGRVPVVRVHVVRGRAVEVIGSDGTPWGGMPLIDGTEPEGYIEQMLDLG